MPFPYPTLDLATLDGTNGFSLAGAGTSVASGDVNGDGIPDLVMGLAQGSTSEGRAYVVFGRPDGFPATSSLSSLDGANGFRLTGRPNDFAGFSVATADVNGDGLADVVVSAMYGGIRPSTYVVFGKATGFAPNLNLATLSAADGFRIVGDNGFFGQSVSSAGDVNGDGVDDIIIGSPRSGGPHGSADWQAGAAYVLFGSSSGLAPVIDVHDLNGINGFKLKGEFSYGRAGVSVSSAGDLNGDGFDDLVVGADLVDVPPADFTYNGAAYIVFGKASGFAAELPLATLDGSNGFKFIGSGSRIGHSVASAGDINGDGLDDLIVGPGYVIFGTASGFPASLDPADLDGANGFRFRTEPAASLFSPQVAAADVNGDGLGDLIVSARRSSGSPGGDVPAAYVVYGKATGFPADDLLSDLTPLDGFRIDGGGLPTGSWAVASAGDLNGDGRDDLALGGVSGSGSTFFAKTYVVYGPSPAGSLTLTGDEQDNVLTGAIGDDQILGLGGDDTLQGSYGDDRLDGGTGIDTAGYDDELGPATVDLRLTGPQPVGAAGVDTLVGIENLTGSRYADVLTGDAAANALSGRDGADLLTGGPGDDVLDGGPGVDTASFADAPSGVSANIWTPDPQVTGGAGTDRLIDIENLVGSAFSDVFKGNRAANLLQGRDGDDVLEGGPNYDRLQGGPGNDAYRLEVYEGDIYPDLVVEAAGEGTDTVYTGLTYTLTDNVENLVLRYGGKAGGNGNALANAITGNTGDNILDGRGGDDTLDGGVGNDSLEGGFGDDRLTGGDGIDTASYAHALAGVTVNLGLGGPQNTIGAGTDRLQGIENLAGSDYADSLKGGAGTNVLEGRGGNDVLEGGAGADVLKGGAGDDTYYLEDLTDQVVETLGDGIDTVYAGFTYALADNVENLVLRYTGAASGFGNALDNAITGNAGNNLLDGRRGHDTLTGGAGNDTFKFASILDTTNAAPDLVTDFAPGDKIDLSAMDANTATAGDQAFHLGATAGHAGDAVLSYDGVQDRTVLALYVNADAAADATVWLSGNHSGMGAGDFVF